MKKYKHIIFDLDGTLVDTLPDISNAMNKLLKDKKHDEKPINFFRGFIGAGTRNLVDHIFRDKTEKEKYELHNLFIKYYATQVANKSKAYTDINRLLKKLNMQDIAISILTNKLDILTQPLVNTIFPDIQFQFIIGISDNILPKPNPDALKQLISRSGIEKESTLFVGDTHIDFQTANNADINYIAASWGYQDKDHLLNIGCKNIVDSAIELEQCLFQIHESTCA